MSPAEYRALVARLGLSPPEVARALRVDRSLPGKWDKGDRICSGPAEVALKLLGASGKPVGEALDAATVWASQSALEPG